MRVLVTSDWQLTVAQTNCSASIFNFGTAEMAASQKFGYPALDILCTLHEGQSQVAESVPEGVMFSHLSFYTVFFLWSFSFRTILIIPMFCGSQWVLPGRNLKRKEALQPNWTNRLRML